MKYPAIVYGLEVSRIFAEMTGFISQRKYSVIIDEDPDSRLFRKFSLSTWCQSHFESEPNSMMFYSTILKKED